jgi:glycosyltransferase involved in cell wall biosynthesis
VNALPSSWRGRAVRSGGGGGDGPRRVLVVTTVHQADDPRVRARTAGVLARRFEVRYATKPPAPRSVEDVHWVALEGPRWRRWFAALREALRPDVGVVSIHDPELIPAALLVRMLRRRPVVVDVHEDVPGQIRTKAHVPAPLRAPLALAATVLLRGAERWCTVTLAEAGYQRRFRRPHPVLANYPIIEDLPAPAEDAGYVAYIGDITEIRGAVLALEAVAAMQEPRPLTMVGRCLEPLRSRLRTRAAALGVDLDLPGFLPHAEAMRIAAGATVGLSPLLDVPNYRRSLPTKVIEYLSLGVPVVASDLPGTVEVIGGLPGVRIAAAGEVTAWTAALDEVCADAPARRAEARANAEEVRRRYSWPAEELLAIYEAALAG